MLAETKDYEDGGDVYSSTVCKIFNFTTSIDEDNRSAPMDEEDEREHTTILIVTKSLDELDFLSITLLETEDYESCFSARIAEFDNGPIQESCTDKDFVRKFSKEKYGTEPTRIEMLDCSYGKLKLESVDRSGGDIISGPDYVTLVFSHSEHGEGKVFVDKDGGDGHCPKGEIITTLPEPFASIFSK